MQSSLQVDLNQTNTTWSWRVIWCIASTNKKRKQCRFILHPLGTMYVFWFLKYQWNRKKTALCVCVQNNNWKTNIWPPRTPQCKFLKMYTNKTTHLQIFYLSYHFMMLKWRWRTAALASKYHNIDRVQLPCNSCFTISYKIILTIFRLISRCSKEMFG